MISVPLTEKLHGDLAAVRRTENGDLAAPRMTEMYQDLAALRGQRSGTWKPSG